MKIFCPQCAAANTPDSQFCAQCGAQLLPELEKTVSMPGPVEIAEEEQLDLERLSLEGPLLVVVKGIGVGQTFSLKEKDVLIGRDPGNDIFLDDITVSRRHAQIKRHGDQLHIVDVGSLNGTYLNRERVDRGRLTHRDEIQIGRFKMIFVGKSGGEDT